MAHLGAASAGVTSRCPARERANLHQQQLGRGSQLLRVGVEVGALYPIGPAPASKPLEVSSASEQPACSLIGLPHEGADLARFS